ncbi:MAG: hypothetical protein R2867_10005 [Caldilineaceae bacterium]
MKIDTPRTDLGQQMDDLDGCQRRADGIAKGIAAGLAMVHRPKENLCSGLG